MDARVGLESSYLTNAAKGTNMGLLNQIAQPSAMPSSYMTLEQWLQNPENAQAAEQLQAQYDMQDSGKSGADAAYNNWMSQQNAQAYGIDPTHIGAAVNTADTRNLQNIASVDELLTRIANNTNPDFPTLQMTPERRQQILQQVAQAPADADWRDLLTPEERQPIDIMTAYESQNQGHDPMAKALMAAMIGGFGAIAGPSILSGLGEAAGGLTSTLPESYWSTLASGGGVASDAAAVGAGTMGGGAAGAGAAGEFSLLGGAAGAPGGGLFSGAGGVTGLSAASAPATAGGLGLSGAGVGAGALLTPALAAGAGILPSTALAGGLTAAETAGGVATGAAGAGTATTAAAPGLLSRIMNGTATIDDWGQIASGAVTGIGGLVSANQQAGAFEDLANRGWAEGAPSRARYEGSFAPDFDLLQADPLLQKGMDASANTVLRALSAKAGNPYDNPGSVMEAQKYLLGSVYLPQGNTYRSQNATSGQFGTNLAGTATAGQINAQGSGWEAAGSGLESILNPQKNYNSQIQGLLSRLAASQPAINSGNSF